MYFRVPVPVNSIIKDRKTNKLYKICKYKIYNQENIYADCYELDSYNKSRSFLCENGKIPDGTEVYEIGISNDKNELNISFRGGLYEISINELLYFINGDNISDCKDIFLRAMSEKFDQSVNSHLR